MNRFIILLILATKISLNNASLSCRCDKVKCVKPTGCRAGMRPDMCNCCMVCAQAEGELCAGVNHVEGKCGDNLQCIVRRLRDYQNRKKSHVEELVGTCEHVKCNRRRCLFGQICRMVNGLPTCMCPTCNEEEEDPVCGVRNNKEYRNECELKKDECILGKEIGLLRRKCMKIYPSLTCSEDEVTIAVLKSYFKSSRRTSMTLMDAGCKLQENSTHVFYTTKLNECGTKATYTLTSVIYSNVIRTYVDPNSLIIRHKHFQLPFECDYSLRSRNRIQIYPQGEVGNSIEDKLRRNGVGVLIREVKPLPSRNYRSVGDIRVDVDTVKEYFVEFTVKKLANILNAQLYPKFCYVTPVLRAQRWMRYTIIENGCPVEDGVEILKSESPIVRLSIPGIKFRGSTFPGILVRCKIRACIYKKRSKFQCERNCVGTNGSRRRKRSLFFERLLSRDLEEFGRPIVIT